MGLIDDIVGGDVWILSRDTAKRTDKSVKLDLKLSRAPHDVFFGQVLQRPEIASLQNVSKCGQARHAQHHHGEDDARQDGPYIHFSSIRTICQMSRPL